jgi:D-lactate dehydrogenase
MKIIIYSIKEFEKSYLEQANKMGHELTLVEEALSERTVYLAEGHDVVIIFTNDDASLAVVEKLYEIGVMYVAIRAVGYDNVDIAKARELGVRVANVPEYSPYAIAEHAVALILALNRKIVIASHQVRQNNFTVDKLIGFDLHRKRVGIIGTGRTGSVTAGILHGFGCQLMGFDIAENNDLTEKYNLQYVDLETLCATSDIISVHTPLNSATKYLINRDLLSKMKQGVILINTARGAVMNTEHVLEALENGRIGSLGMDVYEKEKEIFFYDHSEQGVDDEMLQKLMSYPNVIITPHQAFATNEALTNIADTVFYNIDKWYKGEKSVNEL